MTSKDAGTTSNDLVVVLPGIMGSTLGVRVGDDPASKRPIWAPSLGAIWNTGTGHGRVTDYRLPPGIGDEHPRDGVEPLGLMPTVHALPGVWTPIKGYNELVSFMEGSGFRQRPTDGRPANLLVAPYDWRLSNRYNGARLGQLVEPALEKLRSRGGPWADARVVFVCHSMGGLVARWYVEMCGGAEITRKLITLGTPWRGATDSVVKLVNGVAPKFGPVGGELTAFAQSLVSLHQLLPEFAAVETAVGLQKLTETTVPVLDRALVADSAAFHTTLDSLERARQSSITRSHMIIGARQPTTTTVAIRGSKVIACETINGVNDYGDGTVPVAGAVGLGQNQASNLLIPVAEQHGNLQLSRHVLDTVLGIIEAREIRRRLVGQVPLRVRVPELILSTEPLTVEIDVDDEQLDGTSIGRRYGLIVEVVDADGRVIQARQVNAGHAEARFNELPAGLHTVRVHSEDQSVASVTGVTAVWPTMPTTSGGSAASVVTR